MFVIINIKHVISTRMSKEVVWRGYCTPDEFCHCLYIFLSNYNTLMTGIGMFVIGYIPRKLTTALEFHFVQWLLIYGSHTHTHTPHTPTTPPTHTHPHFHTHTTHFFCLNFTMIVFTEKSFSLKYFLKKMH